MENKNSLSLREIAEMAGTSVATVSRVINQNGRFSKETESRVRKIIEEYNYHPNRLARSLRMQRSQVIGVLVPDISNEFFSGIIKEIQNTLFKNGNITLICNTNENPVEEQQQVNMLLGQQVDGIIYIGSSTGAALLDVPVLYIDRDPYAGIKNMEKDYIFIESDNESGGYLAGRELLSKGTTKPAVVCFGKNFSTIQGRSRGFLRALKEADMELEDDLFLEMDHDQMEEGARAARILTEERKDVDGIFFTSDILAVGGVRYLTNQGFKIPEQLRVIGFDGIEMGNVVTPRLTTIAQDLEQIGELAALHILDMINQTAIKKKSIKVPVRLVQRGTT